MPLNHPKKGSYKVASFRPANAPITLSESLRATDVERAATSASLYNDHKARVSASVHHIHDKMRQAAYLGALRHCAKNKTILHLGCGMGLITMLAARGASPSLVVAVDTSSIVQDAEVVAKKNGFENVKFYRGSISKGTVKLDKDMKFDVIVCEWMSSFVTNDTAMLNELIYCRDNHLAEGGVIAPNEASLHVAGVTDYAYTMETMDYWSNVYGFKMTAMKELVAREPTACSLPAHQLVTGTSAIRAIKINDLKATTETSTTGPEDPDSASASAKDDQASTAVPKYSFDGPFILTAKKASTVHYLTFYTDATFLHPTMPSANFILPFKPGSSNPWTEVSAMLPEPLPLNLGDKITGHVKVNPSKQRTEIIIDIQCKNDLINHSSTSKHYFQY